MEENVIQSGGISDASCRPEIVELGNYASNFQSFDVNSNLIETNGTDKQRQKMFEALANYFGEVENPENTTLNTFFKAKYSPLNEVLNTVRPVLAKYGLAVIQVPTFDGTCCSVNTILTHKDGANMFFPALKNKPTKPDVQGMGSTITYLRRFALNAVAGVMGEVDDDGNAASGKGGEKLKQQSPIKNDDLTELCMKKISGKSKEEKDDLNSKFIEVFKHYVPSGKIKDLSEEQKEEAIKLIEKI